MSSESISIRPGSVRAWIVASRPATLTAAITPVIVGTACAVYARSFRAGPALAALAGAILIQIGSNLANDLFDYEKGTDREDRIGPLRVTQHGLLTAKEMRGGLIAVFALAALAGVYLAATAGWVVVAIGLLSIAAAVAYTGGPYPLGYHGLGDLFVFLFFGFVAVCGTTFVQARSVPFVAWCAAIPVGALTTAILVVNNVRDCESDARSGKRTIAVRFGRRAARWEYAILLLVAYAVPVLLAVGRATEPTAAITLATLPLALREGRMIFRVTDGPTLNRALKGTARLLLFHGVLFAFGIAQGPPGP